MDLSNIAIRIGKERKEDELHDSVLGGNDRYIICDFCDSANGRNDRYGIWNLCDPANRAGND